MNEYQEVARAGLRPWLEPVPDDVAWEELFDHVAPPSPRSTRLLRRQLRPIWAAVPAALLVIVAVGLPGLLNSRTPPTTEPTVGEPPAGLTVTPGTGIWTDTVHDFRPLTLENSAVGDRWLFYWGGRGGSQTTDGLLIDLLSGVGRPVSDAPIPARTGAAIVWTGTEFIVFGGQNFSESFADGAAFDPATGQWRTIAQTPLTPTKTPASLWLGDRMLVWMSENPSGVTELPEPSHGQVAIYEPASDTWIAVEPPPFQSVDAAWVAGPNGPILLGGPAMRDIGVITQPSVIRMATLDMDTLTWEQGPDGPEAEAGRPFMDPGGHLTLLLDDGRILSLHGSDWTERVRLPGSHCWSDPATAQGGGRTYVRFCDSFEATADQLANTHFDRPETQHIIAFAADESGRLVVLTGAEDRPGSSNSVRLSIYDPVSPESEEPGPEPSVSEFALPEPIPLRVVAVRPGPASLAVIDLSQRTTTLYPPGINDVPLTFPTDAAAIAPGGEILVWHGTTAYVFRDSLVSLDLQIPLQGNRSGHQEMRALPSLSGDSVWLFAPGSELGESRYPTTIALYDMASGDELLIAHLTGNARPIADTGSGLVFNRHEYIDTGDGWDSMPGSHNSLLLVPTGEIHPIGPGHAIAASDSVVARFVCPAVDPECALDYSRNQGLVLSGLDGGNEIFVEPIVGGTWIPAGGSSIPGYAMPMPTVSPDGSRLLIWLGRVFDVNNQPGEATLVVIDLADGSSQAITDVSGWPPLATWSSDGQWIGLMTYDDVTLINYEDPNMRYELTGVIPPNHYPVGAG